MLNCVPTLTDNRYCLGKELLRNLRRTGARAGSDTLLVGQVVVTVGSAASKVELFTLL